MKRSDRELGMGRAISRRDFLNGVGVVAASALMPACSSLENTEMHDGPSAAYGYPARYVENPLRDHRAGNSRTTCGRARSGWI
jgi:hypothetical protein